MRGQTSIHRAITGEKLTERLQPMLKDLASEERPVPIERVVVNLFRRMSKAGLWA